MSFAASPRFRSSDRPNAGLQLRGAISIQIRVRSYLKSMLPRRQLHAFVRRRRILHRRSLNVSIVASVSDSYSLCLSDKKLLGLFECGLHNSRIQDRDQAVSRVVDKDIKYPITVLLL